MSVPREWIAFRNAFYEMSRALEKGQENSRLVRKVLEKNTARFNENIGARIIATRSLEKLSKPLALQFQKTVELLERSRQAILRSIEDTIRQLIKYEETGDRFVVITFGSVNSGKSSLANHIAGLDYETGKIEPGKCFVEDRPVERLEESPVECTNRYQGFTLPGLLWIDCPGTLSKTASNTEKARQYLKQANLIVFVSDSDAPFKTSEMEELKQFLKNSGKERIDACLVITKADYCEIDEDPDTGLETRLLMPKKPEDLKRQIEWCKEQLRINGLEKRLRIAEPLITSVYIARDALGRRWDDGKFFRNPDPAWESRYQLSGIPAFLRLLTDLVNKDGLKLKVEWPKRQAKDLRPVLEKTLRECRKELEDGLTLLKNLREKWLRGLDRVVKEARELASGKVTDCLIRNNIYGQVNEFNKEKARKELLEILCNSVTEAIRFFGRDFLNDTSRWVDDGIGIYKQNQGFSLRLENRIERHVYTSTEKSETVGKAVGGGAGGLGGAEIGMAIGTAIFPGVGTVIGGVLGGLLGGFLGSKAGGYIGKEVYEEEVGVEEVKTNAEEVIKDTRREMDNLVSQVVRYVFMKVDEEVFLKLSDEFKHLQNELNSWDNVISEITSL